MNAVSTVSGLGNLPTLCRYTTSRTVESDYDVQSKVLGTGMSGPVQLAVSRSDGRQCAVKSLKKLGLSAKEFAMLKSEAEIYLALDHPHVARLWMVYETPEDLHFVMEYMAGGELYDRLATSSRYTEEAAAETAYQMLLAVAYMHAHNIIHRDLKLENFLYAAPDSDQLKLIDFGFATALVQNAKLSHSCGTIYYVAPEVLAQSYTEKADMWSLGVIVYMLLMGSPPFTGRNDREVYCKIKNANLNRSDRFHKLSTPARDFLNSLFVLEPVWRMSASEALEHPWVKARNQVHETALDISTLMNLRSFGRSSQFRRNVLSMVAWSMSSEAQNELRDQFLALDQDNSGTISLNEFKEVVSKRFKMDSKEAEEIFATLDTDNNDEVEYTEFLAVALASRVKVHEDLLRSTFARFDRDGNGKIDREELRCVLGEGFSASEIDDIVLSADTSGDGSVDYDEFFAYFHSAQAEPCRTRSVCSVIDKLVADKSLQIAEGSPAAGKLNFKRSITSCTKTSTPWNPELPTLLTSVPFHLKLKAKV